MTAHGEEEISDDCTSGALYIVATPIGNLGDMTARAIETLRSVDRILTEDTRTFARLAQAFSIATPYESYHDHNEIAQTARIIPRLEAGERFALVSEAGTPGISDPGYRIIKACAEAKINISPIKSFQVQCRAFVLVIP